MNVTQNHDDLRSELRKLTDRTLAPAARYSHIGLLLVASGMATLVAALLLTETGLPARTQLAFSALLALAVCWIAYSSWVLSRRRPMLQRHRVVAGALATVFSGAFTLASAGAALLTGSSMAWSAALLGASLLIVAVALLVQARRRYAALVERRDELLRQIV